MPLQSSGQISINDIRIELGFQQGSNSLQGLSNWVGFGAPHAISEFYGYNACPAWGTIANQNCFGCDYITTFNDGNCGTFNEIIYNATQCGCGGGSFYSCDCGGGCLSRLDPCPWWCMDCGGVAW
jgi:hypothetical protein